MQKLIRHEHKTKMPLLSERHFYHSISLRIRICPQKIQSIFFFLYGVLQPILCGR